MKLVFPVIFTQLDEGYMAYVPDLQINTQGDDLAQAIENARDAIGLIGIDLQYDNKPIPTPSTPDTTVLQSTQMLSMVDIDFTAYKKLHERRTVRRNVSLPCWLNAEADKAGINVSAILQDALKQELNLAK